MEGQVNPGDQGNNNSELGWRAGLPNEFKEHDWAKGYTNVGDFFKSALETKTENDSLKTKVESALFKPSEEATDEEKAEFYTKLGRPEKADDYEFENVEWPEGFGEDMQKALINETNAYRPVFHEIGLTKEQAKALQQKAIQNSLQQWQETEKAKQEISEKGLKSLQDEWGNEYEANAKLASRAFDKIGELIGIKDEFSEFMRESGLGNNPMLIKAFHVIGKQIVDDSALDTFGKSSFDQKKDVQRGEDGRPLLDFPSMKGK